MNNKRQFNSISSIGKKQKYAVSSNLTFIRIPSDFP